MEEHWYCFIVCMVTNHYTWRCGNSSPQDRVIAIDLEWKPEFMSPAVVSVRVKKG